MKKIKVGDTVRLKRGKETAIVVIELDDIKGGVKLDKHLGGFRYWNVDDLVLVKKGSNK